MRLSAFVALSITGLSQACSVKLSESASGDTFDKNECSASSDCPGGTTCRFRMCTATDGELDSVLVEVTPPALSLVGAGERYLRVFHDLSTPRSDFEINLHHLANVRGFVRASDPAKCGPTLPVQVTLTPRERTFGLAAVSPHEAISVEVKKIADGHPCQSELGVSERIWEFSLNVPAGEYDVYVEPLEDAAAESDSGCEVLPQLFSTEIVGSANVCLPISTGQAKQVVVKVGSPGGGQIFEGWVADIVHAKTGKKLSTPGAFAPVDGDPGVYSTTLRYSASGDAYVSTGSEREILRLYNPEGVATPIIQSYLWAISQNGDVGDLGPFPPPVQVEAWVWKKRAYDAGREEGAPATVTLTATSLSGIADGVFASFSTTAEVEEEGLFKALVPPGSYRARVVPEVGSGLAATESKIEVACVQSRTNVMECDTSVTQPAAQTGKRLLVPEAASIAGRVTRPFGAGSLRGALIMAVPSERRARRCTVPDGGADGGTCTDAPVGVLDISLGDDELAPRAVTGSMGKNGGFELTEADCGACEPGAGAFFDISVRPIDGSGLPWTIRQEVSVEGGHTDLGTLEQPLPVAHRGIVQVPKEGVVPGALIRAYILRDNKGDYVTDPEELPSCEEQRALEYDRCIRSVLQVAETRAADDGTFTLVLPSRLD